MKGQTVSFDVSLPFFPIQAEPIQTATTYSINAACSIRMPFN